MRGLTGPWQRNWLRAPNVSRDLKVDIVPSGARSIDLATGEVLFVVDDMMAVKMPKGAKDSGAGRRGRREEEKARDQ